MNEYPQYMAKKKTIWKNRQGNICFRYEHHSRWWIIPCIVVTILIIACLTEYFTLATYLAIIPSIFISLFVIYNCTLYSERQIDKAILDILKKELTTIVKKELAKRNNVYELKRKLFYKYKGTYGAVESRSVLVLLSDKTVLACPLLWNGGDEPYYELVTDVKLCLDRERIEFICPRTIKDIIGGFRVSDDNKLRIILFGLLFVSLSILIGIGWLVYVFGQTVLFYFVAFLGAITVLNILQDLVKNRLVSTLNNALFFPLVIIGFLVKLAHPIMVILGAFVGVPFFIVVAAMLSLMGVVQLGITIDQHTMVFISLTLTSILCVHSRNLTRWMITHSPIKDNGNHLYEKFSEQLALYITEPQNYNFLFSLLYVVFLSLSAYYNIEYGTDLINKKVDLVFMKSFLVFLAFNTMMQRSQETIINTKDLLTKVLGLFEHDK